MLKVFMNTWGNYNENGADGGEWITLPMDEDKLEEKLVALAESMGDHDTEWAIHDYEWESNIEFGEVHEMDNIVKWNLLCEELESLDETELKEIAAAIEAMGYSLEEAIDRQQRGYFSFYPEQSMLDVAYYLVDECYITKDTPEIFSRYFDYDAFARDLGFDGYYETSYGVICE